MSGLYSFVPIVRHYLCVIKRSVARATLVQPVRLTLHEKDQMPTATAFNKHVSTQKKKKRKRGNRCKKSWFTSYKNKQSFLYDILKRNWIESLI